jgi:sec-independent protein translocase protein TatA
MFGRLGPLELGIILVVVLLLFGANRLPQLGASIGKTVREFRKGMHEATEEIAQSANAEPPALGNNGATAVKVGGSQTPAHRA